MSRIGRLFDRFRPARTAETEEFSRDGALERWMVVGLGNPGEQYRRSRHNAGFMTVERMAAARNADFSRRKFNGEFAEVREDGVILMLVRPETFYNRSGDCVAGIAGFFRIPPERIIVIHDDMDLPVGQLRVKRGGGDAGNRGVRSIAGAIGKEFNRVRIGIGHPESPGGDIDYVLRPLSRDELIAFTAIFDRAAEAAAAIICDGLERAMNRFNQRA
jgi:PTH1 family peptidyl-tRNA hydrolase